VQFPRQSALYILKSRDMVRVIRDCGHGIGNRDLWRIDGKSHMDQDQIFWDHGSKYSNFKIRDQRFRLIIRDHDGSYVPCHDRDIVFCSPLNMFGSGLESALVIKYF